MARIFGTPSQGKLKGKNPAATRVISCYLCGAGGLLPAFELEPSPIGDDYVPSERLNETQEEYPLELLLCRNCGHLQLSVSIDPERIFGHYLFMTASSPGLLKHFELYADQIRRRFDPAPGSLAVDVGSNDGSFLKFLKAEGLRVLGVDPAVEIAKKAAESGIETLPFFFTEALADDIHSSHGAAAVITANNVFAHAVNLGGIAEGIRRLLAPDGVFLFEVSYLVDILQKNLFDTIYHEHLSYHRVKPLCLFFKRYGLELVDVERISSKGGSLRGTVQRAGGPRPVSPAVAELITLESQLELDQILPFRAFSLRLDESRKKFRELLSSLKARHQRIAGYGASPTVTTLIYHFGLGDFLEFIVDDNPLKQNLYSPGLHLPVYSPRALYEKQPDYTVILVWNYADAIIGKHPDYLAKGRGFLVPLPEARVIHADPKLCLVCRQTPVKELLDLGLQPVCHRFTSGSGEKEFLHPLKLGQCAACGLVQLMEAFPAEKITPIYDWLRYDEPEDHLDRLVETIVSLPGLGPESVVRGAGPKDDSTLARLEKKGFKWIFGSSVPDKGQLADLIVARHILEHAPEPLGFVEALKKRLKPEGYLVFEVPDCARSFEALDYTAPWEEHVLYFTEETFRGFFREARLALRREERYAYPLEDSLTAIAQRERRSAPRLPGLSNTENEIYRAKLYAENLSLKRGEYREWLAACRQKGEKVAFLGAGHRVAAFINFFGLKDELWFVVDDDPNKQGLRMPGSRLPIRPGSALAEEGVRCCLLGVRPGNEEKVFQRHQPFLSGGGKFFSIFPDSQFYPDFKGLSSSS